MEDIKQQVGQMIREARKAKGMTQKELAGQIGVTRSIVSNYEAGHQNLTIETLQKIAESLQGNLFIGIK